MHLSFDNIAELDEFLNWAGRAHEPIVLRNPLLTRPLSAYAEDHAEQIAPDEAKTPEQAAQGITEGEDSSEPQVTKRKRRTKAEMQADAERETGLQQPGTLPEGVGTEPGASTPETGGNAAVQAALAGNVVAATEALNATPIGDNPFANMSPAEAVAETLGLKPAEPQRAVVPAVGKPNGPEETRAWIEMTAVGKFNAITPVDHMNLAKDFIAAKGMASYNESFGLVGLSNNIMAFSVEQRALHAAALDFLDWE